MSYMVIFFCIIFHIMFDENAADRLDKLICSYIDFGLDCYIEDVLVGTFLTKTIQEIDWIEATKTLDSLIRFDSEDPMRMIEDEKSS